ncbi:craniofacial development protein 1 isoform X2 [Rhinoderma darwinii]|uniref:craniofacial development protein 1 isoform X2 n=1 Tax=Rhinoderma darwinii TaxID=43563 RepID=UPI003F680A54
MSDSEDYSSSEDEDYVPSGGEYSEDDVNELVKEDDDDDDEEQEGGEEKASHKNKTKKKNENSILARKRKKGVLSLNTEEGPVEKEEKEEDDIETFDEVKKKKLEEAKKKKEEDLWSSFLSDVGKQPKSQPAVPAPQNLQTGKKDKDSKNDSTKSSKEDSETVDDSKKLTITKVFDFAGEEIRVTKEVDCSSREAKEFIKQQETGHLDPSPAPSRTDTAASSGYIERKAFLERVDYRQFELEREIRLKNMKP